ncbi:MAG: hypothetical protein NWF06_02865 [Candidatus Bathyarchaeota archaeon]|nr:hypothetical protein [Candidatus Bathyarchaeum sp.]
MAENEGKTEKVSTTFTTSYSVKPLTQSDKWNLVKRFLFYFVSSFVAVGSVFYFSFSLIDAFPDYVPISTADSLLEIMIQTNGILLGFVGIIFAQMLSSVMSQQTALYEKLFENPEEANNRAESLKYLTLRQNSLSLVAVSTFFCLIFSIFSSMAYIARNSQYDPTDTWATFGFLFVPLLFTIVAILLLILAFTVLPSTPKLEEKKTE